MEYLVFAVAFVVTGVMFLAKKLAGLDWFLNGASALPFLRFALILFSLLGIISSSLLTGTPIDPDSISSLVRLAFETIISAFGSHWIYVAARWVLAR
jgi:uncharacterized membrane protein